jgi:hypothetical protein
LIHACSAEQRNVNITIFKTDDAWQSINTAMMNRDPRSKAKNKIEWNGMTSSVPLMQLDCIYPQNTREHVNKPCLDETVPE